MQMLTAKDVARFLNLPLPRVYELTRQRIIPVVHVGPRQVRYDRAALRQWVRKGGVVKAEARNIPEVSDQRNKS
jgi:excisionase family DNA binding protein